MKVVSSAITSSNVEADGRRRVVEIFVGDDGVTYSNTYLADPSADINLVLTQHATALEAAMTANGVPYEVTALQARLALTQQGLRSQAEAAVAAASQDIKDYWAFANPIHRDHPILLQMATSLGWTSAQLDSLFTLAATL